MVDWFKSRSRWFKSRADLSRNDPPLSHRDRLRSPPLGLRHDLPIPDVRRVKSGLTAYIHMDHCTRIPYRIPRGDRGGRRTARQGTCQGASARRDRARCGTAVRTELSQTDLRLAPLPVEHGTEHASAFCNVHTRVTSHPTATVPAQKSSLITDHGHRPSHILIVSTTYTAVNDTIAVDPSRIPASARAHRGSGARLHRSPPHTHTAADRVGLPSTPIELVAVAGTPERHARTPHTGVPHAQRRAHQLPLVGRPIHAYDVIHSATA